MKLNEYLNASGHVWKDTWFQDNNDELHALFSSLENYILELKPGEHIPFIEVYTSQVYPKTIILDGQNCILWDNHFWRLFGHFINLFFLYQDNSRNKDILMYLKSLQLLFLSSRFDRVPALSRFLAEEYKNLSHKIPSHNESDNIIEILKHSGHFEEFNMCRIFGFCHEIAHIAIKQNNTLASTIKNVVVNFCKSSNVVVNFCKSSIELCELIREIDQLHDDKKRWIDSNELDLEFNISKQVLDNKDGAILDEMCCDVIALYTLSTYFDIQGKNNQQIADNLGNISLFYLFTWWLASNERFWDTLRKIFEDPVANDDAFVDENNPYYRFGDEITKELSVRISFPFGIFSHYSKIPIDNISKMQSLQFQEFLSFMQEANGYDSLNIVLPKYSVSKRDFYSNINHQYKRDKLVGW